jgi:hypothetical protein
MSLMVADKAAGYGVPGGVVKRRIAVTPATREVVLIPSGSPGDACCGEERHGKYEEGYNIQSSILHASLLL